MQKKCLVRTASVKLLSLLTLLLLFERPPLKAASHRRFILRIWQIWHQINTLTPSKSSGSKRTSTHGLLCLTLRLQAGLVCLHCLAKAAI